MWGREWPVDRTEGPGPRGDCKKTGLFQAAVRMEACRAHSQRGWLIKLVKACGHEPVNGPLGDQSLDTTGMTRGEALRARGATYTAEESTEFLRRIAILTDDCCPGCGGIGGPLGPPNHAEDCLGPDPEKWELTPEQIRDDLRVMGYTDEKMAEDIAGFQVLIDKCAKEAELQIIGEALLDEDTPIEEVDAFIRKHGGDPEAIKERGATMVKALLAAQKKVHDGEPCAMPGCYALATEVVKRKHALCGECAESPVID